MSEQGTSGISGTLRIAASIAILLIAGLAVLMVFDIVPKETFTELTKKTALTAAIVGLAAVALGLVGRLKR